MKPNITALVKATVGTIWFVVVITIGGELYKPLKDFFVTIARQHWTGKSITSVIVFILLYLVFMKSNESEKPEKGIYSVIVSVVCGGLIIFGFFVWHFFSV
ncbi:hypothetical protein HY967_01020 [Candidatus Jorgensenbacteria bacterium]|nr:hypothetical protein [Candidatus Jorgensenbacteria bacterium]